MSTVILQLLNHGNSNYILNIYTSCGKKISIDNIKNKDNLYNIISKHVWLDDNQTKYIVDDSTRKHLLEEMMMSKRVVCENAWVMNYSSPKSKSCKEINVPCYIEAKRLELEYETDEDNEVIIGNIVSFLKEKIVEYLYYGGYINDTQDFDFDRIHLITRISHSILKNIFEKNEWINDDMFDEYYCNNQIDGSREILCTAYTDSLSVELLNEYGCLMHELDMTDE